MVLANQCESSHDPSGRQLLFQFFYFIFSIKDQYSNKLFIYVLNDLLQIGSMEFFPYSITTWHQIKNKARGSVLNFDKFYVIYFLSLIFTFGTQNILW